ncbi:MAG: dockerin type I domain-containing protein [Phycisphaerae bacterium]
MLKSIGQRIARLGCTAGVALLAACALPAPAARALQPYSIEVEGLASHSTISPFSDVTTLFDPWQTIPGGTVPVLSGDNYPTLGSAADSLTFLRSYPGYKEGSPGNRPIINYQVTWEGGAAAGASVSFLNRSLTGLASTALPDGRLKYTATLPFQYDDPTGMATLTLRVDNTLAGQTAAVSNLHITPTQYIKPATGTAPTYRQEFLRKVSPFSVIRFMDWTQTNSGGLNNLPYPRTPPFEDNRTVEWADRAKTTQFGRTSEKGVPWEEIVELSNIFVRRDTNNNVTSKKDIWINIPDRATDDYVTQLGQLLKTTLDPAVNIYLEYSNELWNTGNGMDRWQRVLQDGKNNNTPQGQYGVVVNDGLEPNNVSRLIARQMAYQVTHISDILRAALDAPSTPASSSRIKPVLAGQTPVPAFLSYALDFLASRKYGPVANGQQTGDLSAEVTSIAVAPYIGNDLDATEPVYPSPPAANDPDYVTKLAQYNADRQAYMNWLFPVLHAFVDGDLKTGVIAHRNLANTYGLKLDSYEGGQHLIAYNPQHGGEVNSDYKQDANRDARMAILYQHLLQMWATESGDGLFTQFALVSPYSSFGSWGLLEELGQTSSPKWDLFMDILAGDANLDGKVDFTDFQILESNFYGTDTLWDQGDFNLDGRVDFLDFLIFRSRFAPEDPAMAAMVDSFAASVPEPGALAVLAAGVLGLGRRSRRSA